MQNKLFLIAVLLSMILVPMERPFGVRALSLQALSLGRDTKYEKTR
ncbi:hypothetical protein [Brevibacillus choshinensis]|nr:hypothetical protein [Brevibacillus choshinensis]